MTVGELVKLLADFDPDLDVVVGPDCEEYDASEVALVDEERKARLSGGTVRCRWVRIG